MSSQDIARLLTKLQQNPLKGDNFLLWEKCVMDVLNAYGIGYAAITHPEQCFQIGNDVLNETNAFRVSGYKLACAIILGSLDPSILAEHDVVENNARLMMVYLEAAFKPQAVMRVS